MNINKVFYGNVFEQIRNIDTDSINCVVTSPPYYGLRDYGVDGQIGLEKTPEEYIEKLVSVFREVKRVLKTDGTVWLNIGDSYMSAGGSSRHLGYSDPKYPRGRNGNHAEPTAFKHPSIKPKDLILIPFMLAIALRADGWYFRQDIIWYKPNGMCSSVKDRCTTVHEYIFLLSKSKRYYYDYDAILEKATGYDGRKNTVKKASKKYNSANIRPDGIIQGRDAHNSERWKYKKIDGELVPVRNKRSVWTVNTKPYSGAHFAAFPPELITPCILAGCPEGGVVLDPFIGSGTVAEVALKNKRNFLGIELNQNYEALIDERLSFTKQENFTFKGVSMNDLKKIVSFSGGRTSAYLCYLMKERYGDAVDFVFMDTGAEHPKTYDFIREVNKRFNLNLTCLRTVFNFELGKGNSYEVISINDIKCDLKPWADMLKKYGTPYCPGGECCTNQMKVIPKTKYFNDKYGRGNYETYLGIRIDEPRRLKPRKNTIYLGDISFMNKSDILQFWKNQPFDLELDEYLGNCLFCIKKGINKVALAAKSEPELAREFWNMLNDDSVRVVERRTLRSLEMYRGRKNLEQIISEFSEYTKEQLESLVYRKKQRDEKQPQLF